MPLYKTLNRTHIDYRPEFNDRLYSLYKGGYEVTNKPEIFLPQLQSETDAGYEDRKSLASSAYLTIMSDVIDYFAALLFAGDLAVVESSDASDPSTIGSQLNDDSTYRLFLNSANLKNQNLEQVIHHAFSDALIYGHSFVGIDFPNATERPQNLLEEEISQTARPYLCDIDPNCIIDWKADENSGKLLWVRLRADVPIQENPLDDPMHKIVFKIWSLDKSGFAKWELYESDLLKPGKEPKPSDNITLSASNMTTFREIPVLCLHLPDGLKLGKKIAPLCENIYQRSSILAAGENKAVNAMRIAFLGPESSAPGQPGFSMVQENPFRNLSVTAEYEAKGLGVLGANDRVEVIEANGNAFKIVDEQIEKQISRIKETVHQMANSSFQASSKAGKSAQSQQEGRHATQILLTSYGTIVRNFIQNIMNCISAARNEDIQWEVQGLDNYSLVNRSELIQEAKDFGFTINNSYSKTFTKSYLEKLYINLLDGTSYDNAMLIRDEINKSVDAPRASTTEQTGNTYKGEIE